MPTNVPSQERYYLVDIVKYQERIQTIVQIMDYITQSNWQVTNIAVDNQLSINNGGMTYNEYVADINGSVKIVNNCDILGNQSVFGKTNMSSLNVSNDISTFNLSVSGNASINTLIVYGDIKMLGTTTILNADIKYLNVSDVHVSNNISIDGNLYVQSETNLSMLHVYNNTSTDTLYVANLTNMSTLNVFNNISTDTLYVANLTNMSTLNVFNNTSTDTLYVSNLTNMSTLTVFNNISTDTLYVGNLTNMSTLNVFNNTSTYSLIVIDNTNTSTLNVLYNTNTSTLTSNRVTVNSGLIVKSSENVIGTDGNKYSAAFFGIIFADRIICPKMNPYRVSTQSSSLDLGAFSIYNENVLFDDLHYALIGFHDTVYPKYDLNDINPVIFNCYGVGSFVYGLDNDIYGTPTSTFDLSANAAITGITYNGPINIGKDDPKEFNLGATSVHISGDVTLDNNVMIGGNITSKSDKRLKENITPLTDCLSKINKLNGCSFTRNDLSDKNKKYLGLIAQEVEEVFPELVTEVDNIKSVNYQAFTAVLLECVKELSAMIQNKIL